MHQHDTTPHHTTPHHTTPHHTTPHHTTPHHTTPHHTTPHHITPHRTAPHRTAPHRYYSVILPTSTATIFEKSIVELGGNPTDYAFADQASEEVGLVKKAAGQRKPPFPACCFVPRASCLVPRACGQKCANTHRPALTRLCTSHPHSLCVSLQVDFYIFPSEDWLKQFEVPMNELHPGDIVEIERDNGLVHGGVVLRVEPACGGRGGGEGGGEGGRVSGVRSKARKWQRESERERERET
jgi:hypothetical protein